MALKGNILVGRLSLSFNKIKCVCMWILMSCIERSVIGMVTLSPMMVAPVCRVGDPLQLTCTASVEFIRWSIVVVNEQGMEEDITVSRNSRDSSPPPRQRVINSTTITFIRNSTQDVLPLISLISIDSVSVSLNGTVVHCMDANNPMVSASTIIHIIDMINNLQLPTLLITSKEYEGNNVTVMVNWDQQEEAMYTVSVVPPVPIVLSGSTSCQLTIPYNIEYNLTVEATVTCQPSTTAIALVRLKYGYCGNPELLLWRVNDGSIHVPNVVGYDGLPIEGSTISFSCPPGLSFIGPNSATCMRNGEWEPDLNRPILCIESEGNLQMDKSSSSNELAAAVSSTVIVFLVISIFTFIAGFVFGHYFRGRKYKQSPKKTRDINPVSNQPAAPLYEDVDVLPSTVEHQEHGLEMKENVAYGPSKSMSVEQQ